MGDNGKIIVMSVSVISALLTFFIAQFVQGKIDGDSGILVFLMSCMVLVIAVAVGYVGTMLMPTTTKKKYDDKS